MEALYLCMISCLLLLTSNSGAYFWLLTWVSGVLVPVRFSSVVIGAFDISHFIYSFFSHLSIMFLIIWGLIRNPKKKKKKKRKGSKWTALLTGIGSCPALQRWCFLGGVVMQ